MKQLTFNNGRKIKNNAMFGIRVTAHKISFSIDRQRKKDICYDGFDKKEQTQQYRDTYTWKTKKQVKNWICPDKYNSTQQEQKILYPHR